eukprot:5446253-Karenia_brevis.AAC.1
MDAPTNPNGADGSDALDGVSVNGSDRPTSMDGNGEASNDLKITEEMHSNFCSSLKFRKDNGYMKEAKPDGSTDA